MIVKTLDGFEYKLKLKRNNRSTSSTLHKQAIADILVIFPVIQILQEIPIKVKKKEPKLYIDLYLPPFNLAIEVHGRQHYEYIEHFHKTIRKFYRQQKRDKDKIEWCEFNNINWIILKYDERENWIRQIRSATGQDAKRLSAGSTD